MKKKKLKRLAAFLLVLVFIVYPMESLAQEIDSESPLQETEQDSKNAVEYEDVGVPEQEEDEDLTEQDTLQEPEQSDEESSVTADNTVTIADMALQYQVYINGGWQSVKTNDELAGLQGQSTQIEAIKIGFIDTAYNDQIEYRVHVSSIGWQSWVSGGTAAGVIGNRVESIQIRFKEGSEAESLFWIYYSTNTVTFGELGLAFDGQMAGTSAMSERLNGITIGMAEKGDTAFPAGGFRSYIEGYAQTDLSYSGHIQRKGDVAAVTGGQILGTVGQNLRVEGIKVALDTSGSDDLLYGGVTYRTFVQNKGWLDWKSDGAYAGTTGESLRVEGLQVKLTDEAADFYNIYYRVHVQNIGWMGWSANGATAGTSDMWSRVEAVQIVLVAKGADQSAYNSSGNSYVAGYQSGDLTYSGHVQNIGDTSTVTGGQTLGTVGKSLRMEGIKVSLNTSGSNTLSGGITYRTHIQNIGWQDWKSNGTYAGTTGQSLRLEAIQIKLTGDAAKYYDVYYRVQVQNIGWMGWAKNGQSAGTSKYAYRMEAIQIKLVAKTQGAPGSTANYYREGKSGWYYESGYKFYYSNHKKIEDVRNVIDKQSNYEIKVNKQQSCITVYAKDGNNGYIIPVISFACSPGTATPLGTFYTPAKYRWKALIGGVWGQ